MCVHVCVHTYVCACVCLCVFVCVCTCVCVCVCTMCVYVYMCVCVCVCVCVSVFVFVFECVCICVFLFLHREALQLPHLLWIDNFSKFISRSIPTADKGVFSSCLWTGVSLFALPEGVGEAISDRVQRGVDGHTIPAMPRDILQYQSSVMNAVYHVLSLGPEYNSKAAVTKYKVRTVPLKVDTNAFDEVADNVNSYNMSHIRAIDLLEHNIGSNRGLLTILDTMCRERNIHGDAPCTRYTTFNVDENIFWRILKVHNRNQHVLYRQIYSQISRSTNETKIFSVNFLLLHSQENFRKRFCFVCM
jgi:hypothetical protein